MIKHPDFRIGDWVTVYAITEYPIDAQGFRLPLCTTLRRPFRGQVVGATYRQLGKLQRVDDSAAYFKCTSTQLVILVRRGMTNRSVNVQPKDLFLIGNAKYRLPWRYSHVVTEGLT